MNSSFSPCKLFVCTYVGILDGLRKDIRELTNLIAENLTDVIIAVDSNFNHAYNKDYYNIIINQKPKTSKRKNVRSTNRKLQGDGTSFNSTVEITILRNPNDKKVYKIKCFSTTGHIQIPGVIKEDLSDGDEVLNILVNYLNKIIVGLEHPITIRERRPNMVNCNFALIPKKENSIINLSRLSEYIQLIMHEKLTSQCNEIVPFKNSKSNIDWNLVYPEYIINKHNGIPNANISFNFKIGERTPLVQVFRSGRITIIGGVDMNSNIKIYNFMSKTFDNNWENLISIKPKEDHSLLLVNKKVSG